MSCALSEPTLIVAERNPTALPASSLAQDVLDLFWRPSRLYADLPMHKRTGAALTILVSAYVLYGFGLLSTGIHDYEIQETAQRATVRHLQLHHGDDTPDDLNTALDMIDRGAVFSRAVTRLWLLLGRPATIVFGIGLLSGTWYLVIAMRGTRPDFRLIWAVITWAHCVEIPHMALRLVMASQLGASRIETSAAALATGPEVGLAGYVILRQFDPFTLWYWCLVALGIHNTGQMKRRGAAAATIAFALVGAVGQAAVDLAELVDTNSLQFAQ